MFLLGLAINLSYTQTKEIVIDPEEVIGKYVTGDPEEYLDIKKDGRFFLKEKGKYYSIVGAPETTGKWEIEKDKIIFFHPLGIVTRGKIEPNVIIDEEGKIWFKEGSIPQSINEVTKESEESPQTKANLVAALQELKDAMLFKIDADIENTALSFSLVKDYWRIKRWADLARAPLRVLQGTLSLLAKASDWSSFNESIKGSFDHSESIAEFIGVGMMVHGLREEGEKLYFAIKGPPYVDSVEAMLKEADTTQLPLSRFDKDQYKKVIVNRLYGPENSPLTILRKTPTPPESAPEVLNGALQVRKIIISTYNQLVSQIEDTPLPENFPLNETIVHIKRLRSEIANSTIKTTKIKYLFAQENIKKEAEVDLGVPGSFHSAFSLASGNLDQDLRAQQIIEWLNLAGTAGNIIQISLTYEVPGKEAIKIVQQVDTLGKIILNGRKLFQKDLEEDFYMLPQAMLHSLPAELSNLLRISDGTVSYLSNILNTLLQPIKPPEEQSTPVTSRSVKPLTSTEFTVLGTLHRYSFQEAEIAPVVLYEKGKYTSLYFVFREEELESQTAKQIRQIVQDIETFWFYREHSLVGRLGVTAIIPKEELTSVEEKDRGVIYLPSYRIVASGRWLESMTEIGGISWALSRPIPQPFWPQKRLTDDQVVSLDKLSISIMESLAIQIAGKTKKGISHIKLQNAFANRWNRDTLIMDLDGDGLFEVYVKFACDIGWGEPSLHFPLVVRFLATWENGWKTNYRFGYIGSYYQRRIAEGGDPFFFHPYWVGDVNGDGIAEVISPAEKGITLYEVQKRNLIKILDIQNFPIGLLQ
jgi:hypothetical protein